MSKVAKFSGFIVLILSIAIFSFLLSYFALAWTEPTAVPPANNVSAPINVSTTAQTKNGSLSVTALYDTNNNAYFLDPASAVLSANLAGKVIINAPEGAGNGLYLPNADLDTGGGPDGLFGIRQSTAVAGGGVILFGDENSGISTPWTMAVDVKNDRVGIGTTWPNSKLYIQKDNLNIDWGSDVADRPGLSGIMKVEGVDTEINLIGQDETFGESALKMAEVNASGDYTNLWSVWRSATTGGGGKFGISYITKAEGDAGAGYWHSAPTKFTILPSGNVGIGTTDPTDKLTISSNLSGADSSSIMINNSNPIDAKSRLRFLTDAGEFLISRTSSTYNIWPESAGDAVFNLLGSGGGTTTDSIRFLIKDTGGVSDQMIIKSNGNVGIGTANPNAKLHADTGNTANGALLLTKAPSKPAFGILPWDSQVYLSAGVYYKDGSWIHQSDDSNNELIKMDPNVGVTWYASNNGTGSWNVASDVQLWNTAGSWTGNIALAPGKNITFPDGSTQSSAGGSGGASIYSPKCSWSCGGGGYDNPGFNCTNSCTPPACSGGDTSLGTGCSAQGGGVDTYGPVSQSAWNDYGYCERTCLTNKPVYSLKCSWSCGGGGYSNPGFNCTNSCTPPACSGGDTSLGTGCSAQGGDVGIYGSGSSSAWNGYGNCERYCKRP